MAIPVFILFGQTAVGKTELLSNLFSSNSYHSLLAGCAEVVNADSVQVYKNTSVCSAMPDEKTLLNLPHHLVNFKEMFEEFSVSDFVNLADKIIPSIIKKKSLPVVAGGAGFFITNFIYGLPSTPTSNPKTRALLQERLEKEGIDVLFNELKKIDPVTALKLNINDEYRILRALEVFFDSNMPLSSYNLKGEPRKEYKFLTISIERDRKETYERIEKRADEMKPFLQNEFIKLYNYCKEKGVNPSFNEVPLFKSIGYREFFEINKKEPFNADINSVINLIKKHTKRYAKRQETFSNKIPNLIRVNTENDHWYEKLHKEIVIFYEDNIINF